jgi:cytochrome c oxidase subunit 2
MRFRAFVVDPAEFDSWAAHQKTTAAFTLPKPAAAGVGPQAAGAARIAQPVAGNPQPAAPVTQVGYSFPTADLPKNVAAYSPVPAGLTFDESLLAQGDAARGADLVHNRMGGGCIGCHAIGGTNFASTLGPNLTHIGTRNTIAAGLFPNDAKHLALWIKNARKMKAGVTMPTIGKDEFDPILKKTPIAATSLTDAQIADVVAYLRSLK